MQRESFSRTPARPRRLHSHRHAAALFLALAAACLLVFLSARGASGQAGEGEVDEDPGGAPYVAGELIVTYEESIPEAPVERVTEEVESTVEDSLPAVDAQLLGFPEVKREGSREEREETLEDKKRELEQDPAVEAVDYNYLKELEANPNDPLFGRQWHLRSIAAPVAWNRENGDSATRIAVIDSGVDLDHPDFAGGKIEGRINTTGDRGGPNDANDTNGHGTHVAGIASAATNNNRGVAGTCPDCSLLIARAESRSGAITDASVIAAVNWATANNADVINMSYSAESPSTAERNALNLASNDGITLVAAAGNQDNNRPRYPAAYGNVISVSATTRQETRADYSNFGSTIDVSAPGGSSGQGNPVYSTLPGGYGNKSGTSMSSPVVAGIAGLLSSQGFSNAEIRQRIQATATDLGPRGKDRFFGHGRVDAAAAVGARPRNTRPSIVNFSPRPGFKARGKRVRISATVRDPQTNLRKPNITLFVDGRRAAFRYNVSTDRLVKPIRLSPGRHRIRIVARDGWGLSNSKAWRFSVAKKKSGRNAGQGERGVRNAPGQSVSQNASVTQSR